MTGIEAIRQINVLGLAVRLSKEGKILISPGELAAPYADALKDIITPVREEIVRELQDGDQAFLKGVLYQASQRRYRAIHHKPGESPRVLVG